MSSSAQDVTGLNRKHCFQKFSIVALRVRCRGKVYMGRFLATAAMSQYFIFVFI
jgi:hypothetical protein